MDEAAIRAKIEEIILERRCPAFIQLTNQEHNHLLSMCIVLSEAEWLFEQRIIDTIAKYVISNDDTDAILLAKEIKAALADYYDVHLEETFDDTLAAIKQDEREHAGLRRHVDPINGEVTWS